MAVRRPAEPPPRHRIERAPRAQASNPTHTPNHATYPSPGGANPVLVRRRKLKHAGARRNDCILVLREPWPENDRLRHVDDFVYDVVRCERERGASARDMGRRDE